MSSTGEGYQYSAELFEQLVTAISCLHRGKDAILTFFRGAGVPEALLADQSEALRRDKDSVRKAAITRSVLEKLNAGGDAYLGQRREVLKRVCDWEDFVGCWPNEIDRATASVYRIRDIVGRHDAFVRMDQERKKERESHQTRETQARAERQQRQRALEVIRSDLYALFPLQNPQQRGKALEDILSRVFGHFGILVLEPFEVRSADGATVYEQIDGMVEFKGMHYIVEAKWYTEPIGTDLVQPHLSKVFARGDVGGIIISASGYTPAAIEACDEALRDKTIVLLHVEELVALLEVEADLGCLLNAKITEAHARKKAFRPFGRDELSALGGC